MNTNLQKWMQIDDLGGCGNKDRQGRIFWAATNPGSWFVSQPAAAILQILAWVLCPNVRREFGFIDCVPVDGVQKHYRELLEL